MVWWRRRSAVGARTGGAARVLHEAGAGRAGPAAAGAVGGAGGGAHQPGIGPGRCPRHISYPRLYRLFAGAAARSGASAEGRMGRGLVPEPGRGSELGGQPGGREARAPSRGWWGQGRARPGTACGTGPGSWATIAGRPDFGLETCGCQLHLRPESGLVDDWKLPPESFARSLPETEGWWGALSTQSGGAELPLPFFPAGPSGGEGQGRGEGSCCWRRFWSQGLIRKCGRTCRGRASWTHGPPGPQCLPMFKAPVNAWKSLAGFAGFA